MGKFREILDKWQLAILIPSIVTVALFALIIFMSVVPFIKDRIIKDKEESIKALTQSAWSQLAYFESLEIKGELTRKEAQKRAIEVISKLRYGPEMKDYFWINDMEPKLIMHPYRKDMQDIDLNNYEDPNGKKLFAEFVTVVKKKGAGFVDYIWQWKDNSEILKRKKSYVMGFKPWGWVIGTGIYIEDEYEEIDRIVGKLIWFSVGIILILSALSTITIYTGIKTEKKRRVAERAMEESEKRYRFLANNATDVIWTMDLDGQLTYTSIAAENLFGYSSEQLQSIKLQQITTGDSCEKIYNVLNSRLEKERKTGIIAKKNDLIEAEFVGKFGDVFWGEITAKFLRDKNGTPIGVIGVTRDISDRKKAEQESKAHLDFLENMEKINSAIRSGSNVEKMLEKIVEAVAEIFEADRCYFLYPANPEAKNYRIPVRWTNEEFNSGITSDTELPMESDAAEAVRLALKDEGPHVVHVSDTESMLIKLWETHHISTQMFMALKPKTGQSWVLGIQQCLHEREFTEEEKILFREIGRRVQDALSTMLVLKDLAESDARFKSMVTNIPGIIYRCSDLDNYRMDFISDAIEDVSGYPAEEFTDKGKNFADLIYPDDLGEVKRIINSSLKEKKPYVLEYRLIDKDGSIHWIYEKGMGTKENNEWHLDGAMFDVTDKKKYEEEIVFFKTTVDKAPFGVVLSVEEVSTNREKLLYVNEEMQNIVGYTLEEIGYVEDFFVKAYPDPEYRSYVEKTWVEAIKEAKLKQTAIIPQQYRIRNKNGNYVEALWLYAAIGEKSVIMALNVTDRVEAEKALVVSEAKYRYLFDSNRDGLVVFDVNGRIKDANKSYLDMLGYSMKELKNKHFKEITPEIWHEVEDKILTDEVYRKGYVDEFEKEYVRKDGTVFPVSIVGWMQEDEEGNPVNIMASVRDITDRKQAEREKRRVEAQLQHQQKLESIGTLAGGVAHEINNPINIIMNFGQLILDDAKQGSDVYENAEEIVKESLRIAKIVSNLLSFSRQEEEHHSKARIEDILESTLTLTNKILSKDQIALETNVAENLPTIKCRSQQIMQVMMNLITNARDALNEKYSGYDENKKISISVENVQDENGDWVRVAVKDSGNGIPEKIKSRIFDPFFTSKPRNKGTGLGLSVSHGIVKDHKGNLEVESKEGSYTVFFLDLPVDNGWKDMV